MVGQDTLLLVTVTGFASLLGVQVHAMWCDARRRRWDLEDRAAARREADPGPPPPGGTVAVVPPAPPEGPHVRRGMSLRGPLAR